MKFVVAPRSIHKDLLVALRKENLFLNVKLISKEELVKYLYPTQNSDSLIYLMKEKGYSYEVARTYLQDLTFVNSDSSNPKIHFLYSLKEELLKNELLYVPLENELSGTNIEIIGYPKEDTVLRFILDNLHISYTYKDETDNSKIHPLYCFDKIEDEVYYVLNEIASLLDKGTNIKDIYIYRRNKIYDYYLRKFSLLFGYQINIQNSESLYITGGVKEFLKLYKENKDLSLSLELLKEKMKDDPLYIEIEDLVKSNILENVTFEIELDYLINKFKEKKIYSPTYDGAIDVYDSFLYKENKVIFVMGFAQGNYPKVFKDDHYLSDDELHSINRLNSKDKTRIDELSLLSLFKSNNEFIFSFSKKNKEGECFISPISRKLTLDISYPKLSDNFYSEKVLKLIYTNLKDMEYLYREKGEDFYKVRDAIDIDYNTYSNSYTYKANAYDQNSRIGLSTTSLNLYSECPFHYYLERVVKIDQIETSYNMTLGNIAHNMFENFRNENFNFEQEFHSLVESSELKASERYIITHNVKRQIEEAINAIKERENYYTNPKIYNEKKLTYQLNKNTLLEGRIDNLVVLDNKYLICIDYKTGGTKFDDSNIEYGLSTQLPTYALLTSNSKEFKNFTVIGLYINNVLSSSLKNEKQDDELIPSYLKLNGKTLGDFNVIKNIDSTIIDGKSCFINGVSLKTDGSLKGSSSLVGAFAFDEYIKTVNELYIKMDEGLRNNEFPISPYYLNDRSNGCSYCPYRDICFVRKNQFRTIKKEEDTDE